MISRIHLLSAVFLLAACTSSSKGKIIFIPDPAQNNQQEQSGLSDSWQIIESQSGSGEDRLPIWVRSYFDGGVGRVETLEAYRGKYLFIGRNRGDNFNALQQWANNFSVMQDLPRLIVQRVEQRLVTAATLYPDDEYGEYYARMIKKLSDEEYPGAVKESVFWTKQRGIQTKAETEEDADPDTPPESVVVERYEFLILFSIDRTAFQTQINNILADMKTAAAPTRDQTAAINKIRLNFFEGF